eukprot:s3875_g2.t1
MTALFLMRKEATKFCNVSRSIGTKQEVTMKEKLLRETEALAKWGKDDLEKHCASVRETPKPIEDLPPDEQQAECLKKLKKGRDLLQQCMANYEEALEKVKNIQYLTKPALKKKETQLSKLEATLGKVKKQLAKGDKGKIITSKDLLKEVVATISEAKEEAKELVQISMRTNSKGSRK